MKSRRYAMAFVLTLVTAALAGSAVTDRHHVTTQASAAQKKDDAPYVKLPATKSARPNRNFYLKPDTNCPSVKWIIPAGLEQDNEVVLKDKMAIALYGDSGTYTVSAYGALGDQASDIASCVITIGTPPPPGPGPGPGPGPNPPPADLTQALAKAWAAETDANKVANVAKLAALYQQGAATMVKDTTLNTLGDLFTDMKNAAAALIPAAALPSVRAALATYLGSQLGTTATAPLDATMRAKAGAVFTDIATALGQLK